MQIDLIHSDRGNRDENDALCTYKSVLVYVTVVKWQRRSWRYLVNICQQRDSEHRIVAVPIFRLCETKCNIWTNSTRQGNGFEWGDGRCGWKRSLHVEGVRLSVHTPSYVEDVDEAASYPVIANALLENSSAHGLPTFYRAQGESTKIIMSQNSYTWHSTLSDTIRKLATCIGSRRDRSAE